MRNKKVIKKLIYILAMFIAMLALFVIFPNSNVKAVNLILELDKQNGRTDKGRAPYGAQFAVDNRSAHSLRLTVFLSIPNASFN